MGCGSFGMMDDVLRSLARSGRSCGAPDVEEHIKMLYAKGQCDRETYLRLLSEARGNRIDLPDLAERALSSPQVAKATPSSTLDPKMSSVLQAIAETGQAVASIESTVSDLISQAQHQQELAESVLPGDETKARECLAKKYRLEQQAADLKKRIASLQEDLHNLEALKADLEIQKLHQTAAETSARANALRAKVKEDMAFGR
jgi:predicted transcriptional regulator